MLITWIYLILTLGLFAFGLNLIKRKKGGLHVWTPPFGYKVAYYSGKPALVAGVVTSVFSFIFVVNAVHLIITGNINSPPFDLFCGGFIILGVAINIFARRYLEESIEE